MAPRRLVSLVFAVALVAVLVASSGVESKTVAPSANPLDELEATTVRAVEEDGLDFVTAENATFEGFEEAHVGGASLDENLVFIGRTVHQNLRSQCSCGKPLPVRQPSRQVICSSDGCPGVASNCSKIVGGEHAFIRDFPWTVALIKKQATGFNGRYRPFCGGTLINDRYVVTASHCVDGQQAHGMQIVINEQDILDNNEAKTRTIDVVSIVMHPGYNRNTIDNDIALIQLQEPIDISHDIITRPACMAASAKVEFAGKMATVVGWGATEEGGQTSTHLQQVMVPVWSNGECRQKSVYEDKVTDNMICAGEMVGGKDSCQGDSGGPLTVDYGGRQSLIGVVSWGYGCARPKSPGIYTRISRYIPWIVENTRDAMWCEL